MRCGFTLTTPPRDLVRQSFIQPSFSGPLPCLAMCTAFENSEKQPKTPGCTPPHNMDSSCPCVVGVIPRGLCKRVPRGVAVPLRFDLGSGCHGVVTCRDVCHTKTNGVVLWHPPRCIRLTKCNKGHVTSARELLLAHLSHALWVDFGFQCVMCSAECMNGTEWLVLNTP